MVQSDITYQDKLNELRLDMSHPKKRRHTFVLVEGESDIRLFRKLFNLNNCNVERVPGGNVKLEECVGELSQIHSLLIGIRDSDFLSLSSIPYNKANMFKTDYHDIEIMMISEDAVFGALCHECTSLSPTAHDNLRKEVFEVIEEMSCLKWLNYLEGLELVFSPGFSDLISWDSKSLDFDTYLTRVLGKSPNAQVKDQAVIKTKTMTLKGSKPDKLFLCNGHDFIKALSNYISSIGICGISSSETIVGSLRISYTINHFKTTLLYIEIKSWSDANHCSILN